MRYIYFDPEIKTITILTHDSGIHGDLIGTNRNWHEARPAMKKFLLQTLLAKAGHDKFIDIKINDCDVPKDPKDTA